MQQQILNSRLKEWTLIPSGDNSALTVVASFTRQDCNRSDFPMIEDHQDILTIQKHSLAEDVVSALRRTADRIEQNCVTNGGGHSNAD